MQSTLSHNLIILILFFYFMLGDWINGQLLSHLHPFAAVTRTSKGKGWGFMPGHRLTFKYICCNSEKIEGNLTRNFRLHSHHFDKEKISTDGYTSGDPVHFAWNNWRKPLVRGRPERHRSTKIYKASDECECCHHTRHVPQYLGRLYSIMFY